jgi:hypothetical protein
MAHMVRPRIPMADIVRMRMRVGMVATTSLPAPARPGDAAASTAVEGRALSVMFVRTKQNPPAGHPGRRVPVSIGST